MFKKDKIKHAAAGVLIALVTFLFGLLIEIDLLRWAIVTPIIGGILKEIYDLKIKKKVFDIYDVFATIWGGWAMVAIIYQFFV